MWFNSISKSFQIPSCFPLKKMLQEKKKQYQKKKEEKQRSPAGPSATEATLLPHEDVILCTTRPITA
jgi:uncharacterized protein (DUF4213/DUF364 family)